MSCEQSTDWLGITVALIAIASVMLNYHFIQTKTKWGRSTLGGISVSFRQSSQ